MAASILAGWQSLLFPVLPGYLAIPVACVTRKLRVGISTGSNRGFNSEQCVGLGPPRLSVQQRCSCALCRCAPLLIS